MRSDKIYLPTDQEVYDLIFDAVRKGIQLIEKKQIQKSEMNAFDNPLYLFYESSDLANYRIRGMGYNNFRLLVDRLKSISSFEEDLIHELKLIQETIDSNGQAIKMKIFIGGAKPPKEPFWLSEEIFIRKPNEKEKQLYDEIIQKFVDFNQVLKAFSIIEWKFRINIEKEPHVKLSIMSGEKDVELERITNFLLPKSSFHKKVSRYFDLFLFSFKLGALGDFTPIYTVETYENPYLHGEKPQQFERFDFNTKGINFGRANNCSNVKRYFGKLEKLLIFREIEAIQIASSRLVSFFSPYKSTNDKFIDGSILLESLLLPHIQGELRFRAALRAAILLGQNEEIMNFVFELVNEAYEIRSKIVHGIKSEFEPKLANINAFFQICFGVYLHSLEIYDKDAYSDQILYSKDLSAVFNRIERYLFTDKAKSLSEYLKINLPNLILEKTEKSPNS